MYYRWLYNLCCFIFLVSNGDRDQILMAHDPLLMLIKLFIHVPLIKFMYIWIVSKSHAFSMLTVLISFVSSSSSSSYFFLSSTYSARVLALYSINTSWKSRFERTRRGEEKYYRLVQISPFKHLLQNRLCF